MATDEELIEAANRGDADAFEKLYLKYKEWVYNLGRRFTGDHEQALDVLQETFIYLFSKLPTLKLTARMTTFLYPVVKHISLGICRENKRQSNFLQTQIEKPKEFINENRQGSELGTVLSRLPEEQREVILMQYVDDMKIWEIAEALDIPVGTVKSRLHNGLRALANDPKTRNYFLE